MLFVSIILRGKRKQISLAQMRLLLNFILFVLIWWVSFPETSGITLHEWASILFGGLVLVHILLSWQWIVAVTKRFLGRQSSRIRFNYVLNWLLFLNVLITMFSGLLISQVVLPVILVRRVVDNALWADIHSQSADVLAFLIIVHLILHRR